MYFQSTAVPFGVWSEHRRFMERRSGRAMMGGVQSFIKVGTTTTTSVCDGVFCREFLVLVGLMRSAGSLRGG